jgi:hypothetical protein
MKGTRRERWPRQHPSTTYHLVLLPVAASRPATGRRCRRPRPGLVRGSSGQEAPPQGGEAAAASGAGRLHVVPPVTPASRASFLFTRTATEFMVLPLPTTENGRERTGVRRKPSRATRRCRRRHRRPGVGSSLTFAAVSASLRRRIKSPSADTYQRQEGERKGERGEQ